ncbi:MAG: DNA repair exonuclease [Oscillospiraceae bacterium]
MKEIKLLHAADLHLDSAFEALTPEAAHMRREGQREILVKITELAESRGVDAVLLCGDIFNGVDIERDTERDFCRAMGAIRCPVLIAPGNHDPYTAYSVWETVHMPENLYIFKNAEVECVVLPGVRARFWGAGFQNAFCKPLLREFEAPEKRPDMPDIMVIHADVSGGESAYNAVSREDLMKCGMDYVALGHIHARSSIKYAGETAYAYPGCTEGRGYDETGEKGAYIITLSDNGVSSEFVPLYGVRYETMSVDISGLQADEAIKNATAALTNKDYCRIALTGECEAPPDIQLLYKEFSGQFGELQLRDETKACRNVWHGMEQDTLSGAYLRKLLAMKNAAKSDEERRIIELAARYGISAIENGGDLI